MQSINAPQVTRSTCPYCGVGCGVTASVSAETVTLTGDPLHPANFGRLCSKGAALADTLDHDGRLLYPLANGQRVSWDEALEQVAHGFKKVIAEHGPDAVAFYVSGQLLTEDYYVANKLMKGFIGSANIDTNSRLCMSTAVAAHKRAFGADAVPVCYEDIEAADLVVIVGSNYAWAHPVLYQRWPQRRWRAPSCRWSWSIRAVHRPATSPICIWRSRRGRMPICSMACCTICGAKTARSDVRRSTCGRICRCF